VGCHSTGSQPLGQVSVITPGATVPKQTSHLQFKDVSYSVTLTPHLETSKHDPFNLDGNNKKKNGTDCFQIPTTGDDGEKTG
jgi:hypothetical protein